MSNYESTISAEHANEDDFNFFTRAFFQASGKYPANVFYQATFIASESRKKRGKQIELSPLVNKFLESPQLISKTAEYAANAHKGSAAEGIRVDSSSLYFIFRGIEEAYNLLEQLSDQELVKILQNDLSFLFPDDSILKNRSSVLLIISLREYIARQKNSDKERPSAWKTFRSLLKKYRLIR